MGGGRGLKVGVDVLFDVDWSSYVSYGKYRDCHLNQRPKATLPVKSQSENYTWNYIQEARKGLD